VIKFDGQEADKACIVSATLRLIRDQPEPPADPAQIVALKEEVRALRQEVQMLRRRDEIVHFYLHRVDEELRLAARLQQDFLPKELPRVGAARFSAMFRPAGYVSGDLYDVFRLDETRVGFYLADAIGHGVPSALLTMFLRTSLVSKEIFPGGYRILSPDEALSRLNLSLAAQSFSQTTFATAVYGVIDASSGDVSIARAGHPLPVLLPGEGQARALNGGGGALLGIFADEKFSSESFRLLPGDRLFIHSDGVDATCAGADADESGAWLQRLLTVRQKSTADILREFSEQLDRAAGSLAPKDDLTIISVEIGE
jgi:phosphoserine phosphatase RsbU/P